MPEYIPLKRTLPEYTQHPNGCGLATLLMLIDPPKNQEIKQFLSDVWKKISPLFGHTSFVLLELQWAIALQYLLLKSLGNAKKDDIYQFFNSRLEYSYDDAKIINGFTQEQNRKILLDLGKDQEAMLYLHYTELDDYVTPSLLMKNLHTMKTDVELKILAEIFNYTFVFSPSEDSTGALYFQKSKYAKRLPEEFKKQWRTLEKCANDPSHVIIFGQYYHWLAVRGIYRIPQRTTKKNSAPDPSGVTKESDEPSPDHIPDKVTGSPSDKTENKTTLEQLNDIFADDDDGPPWHVQRMIIDLNDPATGHNTRLSFSHLNDADRFYIFKKRPDSDFAIFDSFLQNIPKDIKQEIKHWKKYLSKKYTKGSKGKGSGASTVEIDVFREEGFVSPLNPRLQQFKQKLSKEQELEQRIAFIGDRESDSRLPKEKTPENIPKQGKKKVRQKDPKEKDPKEPPKFWEMLDDD